MKFKNVFLLGDSYSAFENYIPEGNGFYYTEKPKDDENDVKSYKYTWVNLFREKTGCNIILNESYSGSTICNTGYGGIDSPYSFIRRLRKRIDEGFFKDNNIDTMLIMGGTNDSWSDAPIGKIKYGDFSEKEKGFVLEGFSYLLKTVTEETNVKNIVFIANVDEYKKEITEGYKEILNHYKIPCIEIKDFSKVKGHPVIKGMEQIAKTVTEGLKNL